MIESERTQVAEFSHVMDRILGATNPNVVFGQPLQAGAYTVITASEVTAGGGFGYGGGSGPQPGDANTQQTGEMGGHGGGGGGGSSGRPVAVISIGPEGVKVEPVVDVTKLGIAAITAWGALALFLARMARGSR